MELEISESNKKKGTMLLKCLNNGYLTIMTLPNHGMDFTPELRQFDFDRYKTFLMSSSYDSIMKNNGVSYNGEQE